MNVLNGTYQDDSTGSWSETWIGNGPKSLFNATSGSSNPDALNSYDQSQPGTRGGSSSPHGNAGGASINEDGPSNDIRGHWRLQIGADNDINNQHEFSVMNATAKGLDLHVDEVSYASFGDFKDAIDSGLELYVNNSNGKLEWDSGAGNTKIVFDGTNISVNSTQITSVGTNSAGDWVAHGFGTTAASVTTAIGAGSARFVDVGYYDTNVRDVDAARNAVTHLDHAIDIDEINRERSYVVRNRIRQFTMSNLTSNIQSIESARPGIEDVDFS